MLLILAIVTSIIVIASALSLFRFSHWVFRGMDFPRLQLVFFAAVLLVVHLVFLDWQLKSSWLLIALTGLCLLWQLAWIIPYTLLWPKEVKNSKVETPNNRLSVITSNVLKTNRNSKALIELVKMHQPDVLVTLESDVWWETQLKVLEPEFPYSVKCPLDNYYGMHVYSRLPFREQEIAYLVEQDVPSIHLTLDLRTGDKVRMHFVHPAPPSPTENTYSKQRDVELINLAKNISETDQPTVVTGDLNDVAWSETTRLFRKISGLLDPRVGRGMYNTFHADYFFLRWPLDHLFHSSHFTVKEIQRLPSISSDHFSLFTTLIFNPPRGLEQESLKSTKSDQQRANQITEKANINKQDEKKISNED